MEETPMATLTKEEFQARITAIGTCEDEAERRELLAKLSEDGSGIYDEHTAAETARAAAVADNEKLREANMKLFLRVGDHKAPETPAKKETTPDLKYENLFNEKGELK